MFVVGVPDSSDEEQSAGCQGLGRKRLPDFGYTVIQSTNATGLAATKGAARGTPDTWLNWNRRFPGGKAEYVRLAKSIGAEAGI